MRIWIRIQLPKLMRSHSDPDSDPQLCFKDKKNESEGQCFRSRFDSESYTQKRIKMKGFDEHSGGQEVQWSLDK
jgi:hypothetical protein